MSRVDDEPVVWPEDAVEVGRIIDAWGVKGWIKVQPHASEPEALFSSRRWYLRPPEGRLPSAPTSPLPRLLRIKQQKEHGGGVVAQADGVDDRSAAEALKGAAIFVSRSSFPTAGEGEYYWVDLLGMAVVNRQGEALGTVSELIDTGAHCVLKLTDETAPSGRGPAERLIPFVGAYVDDVDLQQRRIVVDWGLDY